jgi:hypothetical protein
MQQLIDYFRYNKNVSFEPTNPIAELRLQLLPIILEDTTGVYLRNPHQPCIINLSNLSVSEDFTDRNLKEEPRTGIFDYIHQLGNFLHIHEWNFIHHPDSFLK